VKVNTITGQIIGAAIEVHRALGPGKTEATYEEALAHELTLRGIAYKRQKPVPVVYKGIKLECGYRLDLLVAEMVVGEIKAVEAVMPVHCAQTLTYLKLGGWKVALLLNFNVAVMKEGVRRLVLGLGENDNAANSDDSVRSLMVQNLPSCNVSCGDAETDAFATAIIAAALEVHRELGPGLLPSAYEECLCHELRLKGIPFERARSLPLHYREIILPEPDQVRLLVGGRVVVKPLSVAAIPPVHEAELLSQLRIGGWQLGLLVNFNTVSIADGLKRVVWSRGGRILERKVS
jgi:GxxExxY protein